MNQDHHNTNKRLVMGKQLRSFMLGVEELLLLLVCFALLTNNKAAALFSRSSFPPGFIFGSSSGSYQVLIYPLIFVLLLLIHLASIHPSIHREHIDIFSECNINNFSMKALQMKVVEDQAYGILTPTNIQVCMSV